MNKDVLLHQSKSNYAYQYDKDTLHLWLRTAKDDFNEVVLLYGDPFKYEPIDSEMNHWVWVNEGINTVMEKRLSDDEYDYYFASIKPRHKRVKYAFLLDNTYLYGAREIYDLSTPDDKKKYNLFNYFNFPFLNEVDVISIPSWVKETTWYQIFPDRFRRSVNATNTPNHRWTNKDEKVTNHMKMGGDILGVIEALDYLVDLGITGIYFTPLFESPSNHKYDTTDYFKIDPSFGTNEDFRLLVKEAHKRGIKVVLDAVFNHCGYHHPFFQDVVKHGAKSKYYNSFFIKQEPVVNFKLDNSNSPVYQRGLIPNFHTFAFTPTMPKWNTEDPLARQHLLSVAEYWIKEYDIDGWRLDVSNEVSHDFWRAFKKTVKNAKKEAFIFGENWDYSYPWLSGDQIDTVMNYEFVYPVWQYFGHDPHIPTIKANQFRKLMNKLLVSYPEQITESMFNLVECHDTARVLSRSKEDTRLGFLFYLYMFAYPGSPNIYYGGEVGLSGGGDPDCRRPMIWDIDQQDLNFKNKIKWLIHLRKHEKAFGSSNFKFIHSDDQNNTIGIQTKKDNDIITIYFNPNDFEVFINKSVKGLNLESQKDINLKDIKLNAYGYLIIKSNN